MHWRRRKEMGEGGRGSGGRVFTLVPAPTTTPVTESESFSSGPVTIATEAVYRHRSKTVLSPSSPLPPSLPSSLPPTNPHIRRGKQVPTDRPSSRQA